MHASMPQFARRTLGRLLVPVALAILLGACSATPPARPDPAASFPVAVPFDLGRAGNRLRVEFELTAPGERQARTVFIGYRAQFKADPDDETFKRNREISDHLYDPLPVQLRLWQRTASGLMPVELSEVKPDTGVSDNYDYQPNRTGRFERHSGRGEDLWELMGVGKADLDHAYDVHEIAVFPPVPGRYLLEIETLQANPGLVDASTDLLVARHYLHLEH